MKKKSKKIKTNTKAVRSDSPRYNYDEEKNELTLSNVTNEFVNNLGIKDKECFKLIVTQIMNASIPQRSGLSEATVQGVLSMFEGIDPNDKVESLLASQMVAVHCLAMEMCGRVLLKEQTVDGVDTNINRAIKLMRTFTAQLDTLKKYRTGGKQTIQVQHVNVNSGGQAVVGNVKGGADG